MEKLTENVLSKELLVEMFDYHEDGYLTWKSRPLSHFENSGNMKRFNTPNSGNIVGYFNKRTDSKREGFGYWRVGISLKGLGFSIGHFKLHRIIYALHHGVFPEIVDHIDGDTNNNRISNLRPATNEQNGWNSFSNINSVTGFKGVSYVNAKNRVKKFKAGIERGGHTFFLGLYHTAEEAACAYNIAVPHIHKDFYKLNEVEMLDHYEFKGKFFKETLPSIINGSYDWGDDE